MTNDDTIAFILETQSRTSETLKDVGEKLDSLTEGLNIVAENQKKFDRSLNGIRTLVRAGMKMMVANQRAIKDLAASQAQTEKQLKAFLSSMEKGRNGLNHN